MRLLRAIPIAALAAALWPAAAEAASCAAQTPEQSLHLVDVGFVGTVTARAEGGIYTLRVDEPLKGEVPDSLVVRDEGASGPGFISSADMNLPVGSQVVIGARRKGDELVTSLCLGQGTPAALRAVAASPRGARCRPGARTRYSPGRRGGIDETGDRLLTDKIVIGCGRTSIRGERFQIDGFRSRESVSDHVLQCFHTVLVAAKSSYGRCGSASEFGAGPAIDKGIGQRYHGGSDVVGIHGTISRRVVAVAIRYSRAGVEYRRVGTVIHTPPRVRKALKLKRQFGFYDVEAPVGAKTIVLEARDGSGKLIGTADADFPDPLGGE